MSSETTVSEIPINPPLRKKGEDCCYWDKLKVELGCLVLIEEETKNAALPFPIDKFETHPTELKHNMIYCTKTSSNVVCGVTFQPISAAGKQAEWGIQWDGLQFKCVVRKTLKADNQWAAFTLYVANATRSHPYRLFHVYKPGVQFRSQDEMSCCQSVQSLLSVLKRNHRLKDLLNQQVKFARHAEDDGHNAKVSKDAKSPTVLQSKEDLTTWGADALEAPSGLQWNAHVGGKHGIPQVDVPRYGDTRKPRFINTWLRQHWHPDFDPIRDRDRMLRRALAAWMDASADDVERVLKDLQQYKPGTVVCKACGQPIPRRTKYLQCSVCRRAFHERCLDEILADSSVAREPNWQCADCKACKECGKGGNEKFLLLCEQCDRGVHTYCLKPPLKKVPTGDFYCDECILQRKMKLEGSDDSDEDHEEGPASRKRKNTRQQRPPAKRRRDQASTPICLRDCILSGYVKVGDKLVCRDLVATVVDEEGTIRYTAQGRVHMIRALSKFAEDAGDHSHRPALAIQTEDGIALEHFKHNLEESQESSDSEPDCVSSFTSSNHYLSDGWLSSGGSDAERDCHTSCTCTCTCCRQLHAAHVGCPLE